MWFFGVATICVWLVYFLCDSKGLRLENYQSCQPLIPRSAMRVTLFLAVYVPSVWRDDACGEQAQRKNVRHLEHLCTHLSGRVLQVKSGPAWAHQKVHDRRTTKHM